MPQSLGLSVPSPLRSLETTILPTITPAAHTKLPLLIPSGYGATFPRHRPMTHQSHMHEFHKRELSTGAMAGIFIGVSVGLVLMILACKIWGSEAFLSPFG